MKTYFFMFLLFISATSYAQATNDSFRIEGDIPWLKDTTLYISYQELSYPKSDSAKVVNGHFVFKSEIKEPAMAFLFNSRFSKEPLSVQFILEKGNYTIKGNLNSHKNIEITGGANQESYKEFSASIRKIAEPLDSLFELYKPAAMQKNQEEMDRLSELMAPYQKKKKELIKDYISTHPNSFVSLLFLYDIVSTMHEKFAIVEKLFSDLDTTIQNSGTGKLVNYIISVRKKTSVGATAMDFTLNDERGNPVKLSDFRGKYVFLDFWAAWCVPCRIQNPNIVKAFNKYKDKNFTVLGVSLDTDSAKWQQAIKDDKLTWTQLCDFKGFSTEPAQKYLVRSVPVNYLIDPNGIIIARDLHGDELEKELAKRLK